MGNVLVGFKRFNGKKGPCCVILYTTDFSQRERDNGAVGENVKEKWIDFANSANINADNIGKQFEPVTGINQWGNPDIVAIEFLE